MNAGKNLSVGSHQTKTTDRSSPSCEHLANPIIHQVISLYYRSYSSLSLIYTVHESNFQSILIKDPCRLKSCFWKAKLSGIRPNLIVRQMKCHTRHDGRMWLDNTSLRNYSLDPPFKPLWLWQTLRKRFHREREKITTWPMIHPIKKLPGVLQ